ncbi:MAG: aldolase/citrate lyase family protein [Chloroflexota bacterium]|nr:aldolase/citrate lyase family protein [Chloroflexota bacterium]
MTLEDYLQPNERIVATCGAVYATDRRLIQYTPGTKGLVFREYSYAHISLTRLARKARFSTVLLGLIVAILGLVTGPGSLVQVSAAVIGLGSMGLGFLLGDRYLEITGEQKVENIIQWRLKDISRKDGREFLDTIQRMITNLAEPSVVRAANNVAPSYSGVVPRSVILVPADQPTQVRAALDTDADVVCLDLAESVHPANREISRDMVWGIIAAVESISTKAVWARIEFDPKQADLNACVWPGLTGIVVTVESAEEVHRLAAELESLERVRGVAQKIAIVIALDTAAGVWLVRETLTAHPRILAVAFGMHGLLTPPDFAVGIRKFPDSQYMQGRISAGAIEAGVPKIGMFGLDIAPGCLSEVLGQEVEQQVAQVAQSAREDGFVGIFTTHSDIITQCNNVFPGYRPPLPVFQQPPPLPPEWQPVVPSHFELEPQEAIDLDPRFVQSHEPVSEDH